MLFRRKKKHYAMLERSGEVLEFDTKEAVMTWVVHPGRRMLSRREVKELKRNGFHTKPSESCNVCRWVVKEVKK